MSQALLSFRYGPLDLFLKGFKLRHEFLPGFLIFAVFKNGIETLIKDTSISPHAQEDKRMEFFFNQ